MATTAYPPPAANNSKYYMNPSNGPSPPEAYPKPLYTNVNTTSTTSTNTNNPTSPNPTSATQTPPSGNVSPTNYHAAVRHIRQPRQPMYIPAALRPSEYAGRPTDIPTRPRALDTPPSSKDNSFDSANKPTSATSSTTSPQTTTSTTATSVSSSSTSTSPHLNRSTSDSLHAHRRHQSSASHSSLFPSTTWSSSSYVSAASEPITGPPTSAHWKPDESAPTCAVCGERFSWFFRRHHCRRCGDVVCAAHSARLVPLDQNARFHPRGLRVKACDPCAGEWRDISVSCRKNSVVTVGGTAGEAEEGSRSGDVTPTLPGSACRPILGAGNRGLTMEEEMREREARIGSLARSEGGMVWSTF